MKVFEIKDSGEKAFIAAPSKERASELWQEYIAEDDNFEIEEIPDYEWGDHKINVAEYPYGKKEIVTLAVYMQHQPEEEIIATTILP